MAAFKDHEATESLAEICGCHTIVIPAESYSKLSTSEEQLHQIALLQQKAQRLEAEIDQRKAAERELSDFIENALEGLHKVGPDGVILWANKAELDLLGYEPEEYIGRQIRDFHLDQIVIDHILKRLQNGENIYNQPAVVRCKDGSHKHVLLHSNAYFENGRFVYSRCFTRDMTEIRQADRDRAMLAAIIESSQDAIISKTFDKTIRSWNKGAERLFGYTPEEALGRPITLIIPPERRGEEDEILAKLRNGKRIEHYETVRIAKDGRRIDISLTISPLRDAEGNLIGASKIARDITDHKRLEDARSAAERQLRLVTDYAPVLIAYCGADRRYKFVNKPYTERFGLTPEQVVGKHIAEVLGDAAYARIAPYIDIVLSGKPVEFDAEIPYKFGDVQSMRCAYMPELTPDGEVVGLIAAIINITDRKRAEEQLKAADRRKDEFLATLAHELRNPLAPIRNGLHILRMSHQGSMAANHVYEMMQRQVAHMVRLVDDLLELSRISRGKIELKRERVSLKSIIEHAVETSKPFIESGDHTLEIALPEQQIMIEGDLVRLSQVFANLLNNAAKYTNQRGTIWLAGKCVGEMAVVSVRDTGIGIPRDMLTRVFEMFAQVNHPLRRSQEGLGIGLNLVQSLVQMHGGTVEARSEGLGSGSEFVVRLPLAKGDSTGKSALPAADGGSVSGRSVRRILCVDDNKDSADTLGMMLRFLGADVHTAYDGPSALEAIKICRPSIILMDLGMPGMDGCEVARRIRHDDDNRKIILIALTGWGQEEDRRRSREAGFDHHLVKPVDLSALQALLASSDA
jgi:PAS domain S-box-containing protein